VSGGVVAPYREEPKVNAAQKGRNGDAQAAPLYRSQSELDGGASCTGERGEGRGGEGAR
jgi:hypothetical protein